MTSNQGPRDMSKEECLEGIPDDLLNKMQNLDLKSEVPKQSTANIIIPEWLKDCESPFLWHSQQQRGVFSEEIIEKIQQKLDDINIEEPNFSLARFIFLLQLVFEYHIRSETDKSWATMNLIEELVEKEACGSDESYLEAKLALGHVVTTTKANLLALRGEEANSRKIVQHIIPIQIMHNHDQAALYSMKARFYLYSDYNNGESIAVELSRKALELEPDNAEWKYMLAKMLRRERRENFCSVNIPRDELTLLESAVKKSKNAKYVTYLAQVYRECGKETMKKYRDQRNFYQSELFQTIQNMSKQALSYYKEALELSPDGPTTLRRVGYGIMNLPKKIADYDLALKCLLRSLEISPKNLMTLHILGTYYHRYANDNIKALEYFEKTVKGKSHPGLCDMVRLKYNLDPGYDPCTDLEEGLKWPLKKNQHTGLLVQLGAYHLLVKRDFHKSLEYFRRVIEEDKDTYHMKTFKSLFLRMNQSINMYEYIANEALLLLRKNPTDAQKDGSTCNEDKAGHPDNLGYVEDFLHKISQIHPELLEITPHPSMIGQLHLNSEDIFFKERHTVDRGHQGKAGFNKGCVFRNQGRARVKTFVEREHSCGDDSQKRERRSVANERGRDRTGDNDERRGRVPVVNQRESNRKDDNYERFSIGNRNNRGQNKSVSTNWRVKESKTEGGK